MPSFKGVSGWVFPEMKIMASMEGKHSRTSPGSPWRRCCDPQRWTLWAALFYFTSDSVHSNPKPLWHAAPLFWEPNDLSQRVQYWENHCQLGMWYSPVLFGVPKLGGISINDGIRICRTVLFHVYSTHLTNRNWNLKQTMSGILIGFKRVYMGFIEIPIG